MWRVPAVEHDNVGAEQVRVRSYNRRVNTIKICSNLTRSEFGAYYATFSTQLPRSHHNHDMALTNPTSEEALKLFQDIEERFPSATLGEDKWEILMVLIHLARQDLCQDILLTDLDISNMWWRPSNFRSALLQISHLEIAVQHTGSTQSAHEKTT